MYDLYYIHVSDDDDDGGIPVIKQVIKADERQARTDPRSKSALLFTGAAAAFYACVHM